MLNTKQQKQVQGNMEIDFKLRIAIVNKDKCKPNKCKLECKKCCPVNAAEKLCIEVNRTDKISVIHEELCIGCSLCVKRCPYGAIKIINLPKDMSSDLTHRYGLNCFKLHRLPTPRPNQVLGLVGTNGIGKSTALQILAGKLKPNFGRYNNPPEWNEIILRYRGSDLQSYFQKIQDSKFKCVIKPQYVDSIPKAVKGKVGDLIKARDQGNRAQELIDTLQLRHLLEREIKDLSGGELQRFAILFASITEANVFMFDEPSSYLDVKQRLTAAQVIRQRIGDNQYVICVEHDLSILDYLSDFICCLYGEPTAFGIVTMPFGVREGINIFLAGFIPTENMRFREYELTFKIAEQQDKIEDKKILSYQYPALVKQQGGFKLTVHPGSFNTSQIIVMLGENGTGKTTFVKILAGKDKEKLAEIPELNVSYKPQMIAPSFDGTVRELFQNRLKEAYTHAQFVSDVTRPLKIDDILDNEVKQLSGGELQRTALVLALGKPADVYLIDEPSAYLDAEQRVTTSRIIKRFIMNSKKAAFIVEHDFIMATYLADKVIVYEGEPGVNCVANSPQDLIPGMNKFLSMLGITFRRGSKIQFYQIQNCYKQSKKDPSNFRPRINKLDSVLDKEQKSVGNYFCTEE